MNLFPKPAQKLLAHPKEDTNHGSGEITVTLTKDIALSEDSGIELTCSANRGEDADEDGPYGFADDKLSYSLWCDQKSWGGDDTQELKRHLHEFAQHLKKADPEAHEKAGF